MSTETDQKETTSAEAGGATARGSLDRLVRPSLACVCRSCSNLVTAAATCPLCGKQTKRHPEATEPEGYCVECGEGPMDVDKLHVVTWEEDPYMQTDDGDLITCCESCHKQRQDELV